MSLTPTRCRTGAAAAAAALLVPLGAGLAAAPSAGAASSVSAVVRPLTAYLQTADALVPVDLRNRALGRPVRLPAGAGRLAIAPDGRAAYVLAVGTLRRVDLVTGAVSAPTRIGQWAGGIALTPDGRTAWVTNSSDFSVVPVDLRTMRAGPPLLPGGGDQNDELGEISITPDGRTAYVAAGCSGRVFSIDLVTRSVRRIGLPPSGNYPCPSDIGIAPNGRTAYLSDAFSTAGLSPLDLPAETLRPPIDISAASAGGVVVTPDSSKVFVSTDSALAVVDARTEQVTLLPDDDLRGGKALVPSGKALLLPLASGGVSALDTTTYARGTTFAAGLQVQSAWVEPSQAPVARFTAAGRGARTQHLDASTSVGTTARIASYRWTFGDGTSRTTTTPVLDHTYARAGRYTVRLTVTDVHGTSTAQVFGGRMLLRNGGPAATTTRSVATG